MLECIFATSNSDKIKELRHFERDFPLKNITINDLNQLDEKILKQYNPVESGVTFLQNAFIKARDLQKLVKSAVIAEDSGLQVAYLNNEPGVYSARLAPTSKERNAIILERLKSVPLEKRDARFFACVCYLDIDGNATFFNGRVEGKIALESRGENGFGFDPIFYYPPWQKTFAEVSVSQKQTLSHRGVALRRLFEYLHKFYAAHEIFSK